MMSDAANMGNFACRASRPRPLGHCAGNCWHTGFVMISRILRFDRDRGTPRGTTPPTPPGIRVTYHGGSTGLSVDRDIESGESE